MLFGAKWPWKDGPISKVWPLLLGLTLPLNSGELVSSNECNVRKQAPCMSECPDNQEEIYLCDNPPISNDIGPRLEAIRRALSLTTLSQELLRLLNAIDVGERWYQIPWSGSTELRGRQIHQGAWSCTKPSRVVLYLRCRHFQLTNWEVGHNCDRYVLSCCSRIAHHFGSIW